MNKPVVVGVTGGIGAGKSVVCRIFKETGAAVYDADSRAKWLMNNDEAIRQGVKRIFGADSYNESGLNRTLIAQRAFNDGTLLGKLNELVHPVVAKDFEDWKEEHSAFRLLVKEAALIFDTTTYKDLDGVVVVTAPLEVRMQRVLLRDTHRTEADVKAIISKQRSEEDMIDKGRWRVVNDNKQLIIPQILNILSELFPEKEK